MSAVRSRTGLLPRLNLAGPTHVQQRLFFLSFLLLTAKLLRERERKGEQIERSPSVKLRRKREGTGGREERFPSSAENYKSCRPLMEKERVEDKIQAIYAEVSNPSVRQQIFEEPCSKAELKQLKIREEERREDRKE